MLLSKLDSRYKIQDSRLRIQDSRFKIQDSRFKMNNSYIDYFKNNIKEKTPPEAVEYAIVSLSDIEEKVLEMRSCKYSDDIDDYIDFLKKFIRSG